MSETTSKLQLELEKLVSSKNGKIITGFISPTVLVTVECNNNHQFSDYLRNIRTGSWCRECIDDTNFIAYERIYKILVDDGFDVRKNAPIPGIQGYTYNFGILDRGQWILIDADKEKIFKDLRLQEALIAKVQMTLNNLSCKVIRVDYEIANDLDKLGHFLWSSISDQKRLCLSTLSHYLWLHNKVVYQERQSEVPDNPNILGPNSEILEGNADPLPELELGKFAVLGYIRVSTMDQSLWGVSLLSQIEKIKQFAALKGFPLVRIYADKGLSGRDLKSRPAIVRLLDDLKPRYYVTVLSLSRLARNNRQASDILYKIREKKAFLMSLDYDLDTRTPTGELMFNLLNSLSQFESDQISERVTINMQYLSRQNKLRSRPPFGYDFVDKNQPFIRNEHEQAIIALIAKMKLEDPQITCTAIANDLNAKDLKTKRGNRFYHNTVRKIMVDNGILEETPIEERIKPRNQR
jgi:DNA invertase Pin-like site-specific DNA recombinase